MKRPSHAPSARSVALEALLRCGDKEGFVQEVLDHSLRQTNLSGPDRRLTTQLVYGVLRRRGTLDALLGPLVNRQLHQVEPWIWECLRLGAFQLALLSHIPAHAALFETVELATRRGKPRAKGFLNGVLRNLTTLLTDQPAQNPAADALPIGNGVYRKLSRAALPAPGTHPVEYVAAGFALPPWLVNRWLERFDWDECVRLGFWFAGPAPLWLRCQPVRITRDALLHNLREAGVQATAGVHPQALRLTESATVRDLPGYAEGHFVVQDESAMRVGSALGPRPGDSVLDMCAAPGGKTTHLAELMRNQGRILACDLDEKRLANLSETCVRLGLDIVTTRTLRQEQNEAAPVGPFDAILVDVPCSNTGVLGRRPEVRWRLRPEELTRLVPQQTRLLQQACDRVRPGGTVVYSTCSIEPEENRCVVQTVLQERSEMALEADEEAVPGRPADGGYWARLKRKI